MQQPCLVSEHEEVGTAFNFVLGSELLVVASFFREGAHQTNPVSRVIAATIITEDGTPLPLTLVDTPQVGQPPADAAHALPV